MRRIKYINSLGEELLFGNSAPFILQKFEESQGVNNYNFKGVGQDGETYLGTTLDPKDVSLTVAIIAKTTALYKFIGPSVLIAVAGRIAPTMTTGFSLLTTRFRK